MEVSRATGVPVTMRGAGTSIAGNAVGPGIVVDTVKHLNKVLAIDAEARTATVEPGVVHAALQRAAAPHGLRFGPDPSTHTRCTIGGMIGNNACGLAALGYGRTSDNVVALDTIFPGDDVPNRLAALADAHLAHVRTAFGRFSRQVSGYSLEHLLPERRSLDRFLVGSEGTLGVVREATVSLVGEEPRLLVALGYPSMIDAADAVPGLLAVDEQARLSAAGARLVACEGLDSRIVDLVRARGAVPELPLGPGSCSWSWPGRSRESLVTQVLEAASALAHRVVTDPSTRRAVADPRGRRRPGRPGAWRGRRTPAGRTPPVPPEHLGAWLRDFDELLGAHGLDGVPYGHFGDGCVHVRIDFEFDDGGARFREFLEASARRLADYGGSLSGEHGDGRARSRAAAADVRRGVDAALRRRQGDLRPRQPAQPRRPGRPGAGRRRPAPGSPAARSVRRAAVGPRRRLARQRGPPLHRVGKCVAPATNGVMCPSYLATREEKDSTRGRARVLQEALDGALVGGLSDPAVHEALDLCLACKGCASDCPTGVDMATYKSEALYQKYDGPDATERRPRGHYLLGRLPKWAARAAPMAPVANRMMRLGPVARLAKATAGIDQRRSIPAFARRPCGDRSATPDVVPDVWIWADSFTDHFFPDNAHAAIRFLESTGLTVRVIADDACCGLTWVTTGQLDQARSIMERTVATLAPYVASGVPVIGLEPSCLATLRSDAVELTDSRHAVTVAEGVLTFAELVERLDVALPDLSGVEVVAQPHCHQSAIMGWAADQRLLERAGATVDQGGRLLRAGRQLRHGEGALRDLGGGR